MPFPAEARDTLLLVRLHGVPIDLVHLEQPPAQISPAALLAAAWSNSGEAIRPT